MPYKVAVADSVFPNLDPAKEVLKKIGAELELAAAPTPEAMGQRALDLLEPAGTLPDAPRTIVRAVQSAATTRAAQPCERKRRFNSSCAARRPGPSSVAQASSSRERCTCAPDNRSTCRGSTGGGGAGGGAGGSGTLVTWYSAKGAFM